MKLAINDFSVNAIAIIDGRANLIALEEELFQPSTMIKTLSLKNSNKDLWISHNKLNKGDIQNS